MLISEVTIYRLASDRVKYLCGLFEALWYSDWRFHDNKDIEQIICLRDSGDTESLGMGGSEIKAKCFQFF